MALDVLMVFMTMLAVFAVVPVKLFLSVWILYSLFLIWDQRKEDAQSH
jgi:hypothetical protein